MGFGDQRIFFQAPDTVSEVTLRMASKRLMRNILNSFEYTNPLV
jgi:hypothetical protein